MKIVSLSYVRTLEYSDAESWLKRIEPYGLVLQALTEKHAVSSIEQINYEGRHLRNGVDYHFIRGKNLRFPARIHRLVRQLNPDVLIVHGLNHPLQVIQLRRAIGHHAKLMVQSHAEKIPQHWRKRLQRIADRYVDAYLFTSSEMAENWLEKKLINQPEKIKEVMVGASTFKMQDLDAARSITQVEGDPVFLFVGRVDNNKDPLTLIKAFSLFASANPSASLYVIFQNEDRRHELETAVKTYGNTKRVHLIGQVPHSEMEAWFNSANFIVSTSHAEAFGMAVAEAMSCGCFPVVSNIPAFRKLTANGDCGILFEPGNVDELADSLQQACTVDIQQERKKVRAFYDLHLSADAIAKQIESAVASIGT